MVNYIVHENKNATEWVTFVHGAGGSSSIWFKQIRDFQKHFNVLLIDLRGHGDAANKTKNSFKSAYTFEFIANDLLEIINFLKIKKTHFIGISLGTILIRQLAETNPSRVQSMILGGAILKLNFRSQILMRAGNMFKYFLPYLLLYKLFAFVIMPYKNHKQSRLLFINEAKKLYQKEFIRWFNLTPQINPILRWFRQVELNIPTLYIMGQEDYMFLPCVRQVVQKHFRSAKLIVIKNCGHVVNVEQALTFNTSVIEFIKNTPNFNTI